jgi:hypothetical protein
VDVTTSELLQIDTTTGNGSLIGTVSVSLVAGMAWDANNGILYASTTGSDLLVTIDPLDGTTTTIGPLGVELMHGLEYDSNNDVLYGVTNQNGGSGNALWTVDVTTGTATFVATHGRPGLAGMAFDASSGTMYVGDFQTGELHTINLTTGVTTLIGSFGVGIQTGLGLAFDPVLGLFACDNKASGSVDDELFRVDTSTGAATLVGPINAGNVLGLTFPGGDIGVKYCSANSNSTGSPADISAAGSASSSAGDLQLTSAPVPNQNGIFFHGSSQASVPFGNGFLCATSNLSRGEVVLARGNSASYTYDNSVPKRSLGTYVGTTRNFQHWTRDPMGGGALHNTSNAIAIDILL